MRQTLQHLNDEHMRLYEWSGAGTGTTLTIVIPEKTKRRHTWHASYGVLALLTSLLALNGCDNTGPAEQAGEQVDQATRDMQKEDAHPPSEGSPSAGAAEQAAPVQGATGDQPDSAMQKP
jgi:hypothetical protein